LISMMPIKASTKLGDLKNAGSQSNLESIEQADRRVIANGPLKVLTDIVR
jgi:hypothetical protein